MHPASDAAAAAAWLSAASLALIGVDYYVIVWGLFGALVWLAFGERSDRTRAIVTVTASTICAAALAHGIAVAATDGQRPALIAIAFVVGAGAQPILRACVDALASRIKLFGGKND